MKLLLLVQNENDVAHLDAAAKAILNSAIRGVWLVFSPAVLVNASEAAAKLDGEIAQDEQAMESASQRRDFKAAEEYYQRLNGRKLDRAKEIREAHKKLTSEQRVVRTKELFGPLHSQLKAAGLDAKITSHADHYDPEQWVAMLNSLSGAWFKEFKPGGFIVAWPESVETSIKTHTGEPTHDIPPLLPSRIDGSPVSRAEMLAGLRHFALVGEAKKVNVEVKGKSKQEIISEILAAEQKPAVQEPETVDAY